MKITDMVWTNHLGHLLEAIETYKDEIEAIQLNSNDFEMLKKANLMRNLFTYETDVNGKNLIDGIELHLSPLTPRGSFYFKMK